MIPNDGLRVSGWRAGGFVIRALAVSLAFGCATGPELQPATRNLQPADALASDLTAFAHDSMRGRETGTPDATRAARFLAQRLGDIGLEPVGDSMYFQRVPMVRQVVTSSSELVLVRNGVTRQLRLGEDLAPMLSLGPGQPEPRRSVRGELVFAGYVSGGPLDPRSDLPSSQLADKIAVIIHGAPPGTTGALRDSLNSDNALAMQIARVGIQLPAGIIVLMTPETEKLYRQLYPSLMREVRSGAARSSGSPALSIDLPMILFGVARAGSPFLPRNWPEDTKAQLLGTTLRASVDVRAEPFIGYNVIARVPGTDPSLRSTYVALGAHYDHVGILPVQNGDSIANGADDDGSGSVALLAVARAVAKQPSRRSTLFIWHVAEEKGLLGSDWFTSHPTVPLDSVVAMINADMIGRNERDRLYVVGPKAAEGGRSARLGEIVDSVNASLPSPFTFDRSWDVANHPEQIFQRSDHFNYAKRGLPVVFFTSGLHPEYHDVTDSPDRIDYEKLRRASELMTGVVRAVGNDPNRPRR